MALSPYGEFVSERTTNNYLTPQCFSLKKSESNFTIEFKGTDIKAKTDENGKPVIKKDVIHYLLIDYSSKLTIKDKDGKVLMERIVSLTGDDNSIPILNPFLASRLKKGNQSVVDSILSKNIYYVLYNSFNASKSILDNNFCGYYAMDTMYVFTAKGKKYDYSELESTEELVKVAVRNLGTKKGDSTLAFNNLKKSIIIWEKEIANADFNSSDSRINEEIVRGLNYNIASAYFFMGEFTKADLYIRMAINSEESSVKITFSNSLDQKVSKLSRIISLYLYR
jgi:hypothetical protein